MNQIPLLNWMLLSTGLLGLWWLGYHLLLRAERSFAYNRAYLGLGPLLAAGLPLLPMAWPANWGAGPAALPRLATVLLPAVQAGTAAAAPGFSWAVGLWTVYLTGAALLLARLALTVGRLWWQARRLPRQARAGYTLVETHGRLPTSSFGRVVFWDETLPLSAAEARQVLAHELAHQHQGHTYDRLLLELLRAVLWFNPFVHQCARALALTHEYLADAAALHDTAQAIPSLSTSYAQLLARQVASRLGFSVPLAHSFSHSQTLSRIAMIQKTSPIRRWKQWLALPMLGACVFAVACENAALPAPPTESLDLVKINGQNRLVVHHGSETTLLPPPPVVYEIVDQMPDLPGGGGPEAIVAAIQQKLTYPAVAPASRQDGTMFVSFIVTEEGKVQTVKVLKSLGPEYDAAVTAAIRQLPAFVPGRNGGKPVAVSYTVPVRFDWNGSISASGWMPIDWKAWTTPPPPNGSKC